MDLITRRYRAILLTLFLVISVFADYFLIGPNNFITLLSPSIGLIMIYHMYYKDHFIFSLLVYAFTLLISRFLLISESVGMSLFVVAYKTFALLCMMVSFK